MIQIPKLNNQQVFAIIAGLLILAALVANFFNGGTNTTGSGDITNTNTITSTVDQKQVSGDNIQIQGVSAGGDFNLDNSKH